MSWEEASNMTLRWGPMASILSPDPVTVIDLLPSFLLANQFLLLCLLLVPFVFLPFLDMQ
jgi:hypothetical protein